MSMLPWQMELYTDYNVFISLTVCLLISDLGFLIFFKDLACLCIIADSKVPASAAENGMGR